VKRLAWILAFIAPIALCPAGAGAQTLQPPESASEPAGLIREPGLITRITIFVDRHWGKGDLTNGFYVDAGPLIPGAGIITAGPGYRRWYKKDAVFVDGSAAISSNNYRRAQARFELPALARSRVALGTQFRWQDFRSIDTFDPGPASGKESLAAYRLRSNQLGAHVTLRPSRWMSLGAETGLLWAKTGNPILGARTFIPTGASLTIDRRDFPAHPTRGGLARASVVRYHDRHDGTFTFKQYEGEVAGFLPLANGRVVIAVHGLGAGSPVDESVPFYFQPAIGGHTSLRSYPEYRFHDRTMVVANAELRLALMTHGDLTFFADAGNVAPRFGDLNFDKRSYGVGFQLHTRRTTFAVIELAHGREGWQALFRLRDSLGLLRATRRIVSAPFVP
jgi:hypothetical protein